MPAAVVKRFRRSAVVDIDPGLLQVWLRDGEFELAAHDIYFTIGETVGNIDNAIPDVGLAWEYTKPCISLLWWPRQPEPNGDAAYTSVTHWYGPEWVGDLKTGYCNEKRLGFVPFLSLPDRVAQPLELALPREEMDASAELRDRRLQNAWLSDRTLCYLASGKPAVVQHTGPSDFLPDAEGLFRFSTFEEAVAAFEAVAEHYDRHRDLARKLAEQYFDARTVVSRLLERALP
jgi:hypothetical protein